MNDMNRDRFWASKRRPHDDSENAATPGVPHSAEAFRPVDRCDRCGARAYVRVLLPGHLELLFCAHHNRQYASALAEVATEIHDLTAQLSRDAA